MPRASRPLLEVFGPEAIRSAFLRSNEVHEARRERDRQLKMQAAHEAQQLDARRRRPMSKTISGLGDQIQAALAAARHAQDKALAERRREKELGAAQDETRLARRRSTRNGG